MKKYKIGYTQGVYDMFHIGHLNLINHAKELCDYLIVGVNSDRLVQSYKNKSPVISEDERVMIVSNIKAVDKSLLVDTLDKVKLSEEIEFNVVFIGDDWKGSARWEKASLDLAQKGIDVVFLPHTDGISSTILKDEFQDKVNE